MLAVIYFWKVGMSRLSGWLFNLLIIALLGCTTAAQDKAAYMRQNLPSAIQKGSVCFRGINDNPKYQHIVERMAVKNLRNPSLSQLTDEGFVEDEEIILIVSMHNEMADCREQAVKAHMDVNPGIIPILTQSWQAADVVWADLITRTITFGEANKKRSAIVSDFSLKINAQMDHLYRDLAAAHYAEVQQTQAAFSALAQWSQQQQMLMQNQQFINAVNRNAISRPVITNCYSVGNSVQCTSY
jgi:hypothetical protein